MLGRGTVTIIMRMNRRNVLVGLGTIVAGGGGALATGAFSQVQAERTIAVETTGDEGAYLGLTANNTNIASSSSTSQLTLTINQLNENALTEFEGVFTITNNGNDPVGITIEELDSGGSTVSNSALTWETNTNSQNLETAPTANDDDHNLGTSSGSCQVDIKIDDRNAADPTTVEKIRISANTEDYAQ
jgi:hypothetical protein